MNRFLVVATLLLSCSTGFSQNTYKITWGEEMKLRKGTADLDIISADNTGLYFTEKRLGSTLSSGPAVYKLYKMDKNFAEVFDKEYKKELKGLEFQSFQEMGTDLYMFATDYIRKTREFKVFGAKVDKSNGELIGDFAELGVYELESKKDDYEMKVTQIQNGNAFLLVSNISSNDRVSIGISLLDKNLKKKATAVINLTFEPKLYQLVDVQYTKNNKIILLGKKFEETQIGNKKKKRLIFTEYAMGIYTAEGAKEKDVVLNSQDRYVISGKMIEQANGQLLLAGFYSNKPRKEDLSGFYINRVDPDKGELLLSSFKEINSGMLGNFYEDGADEDDEIKEDKKRAKKAKDDDDEDEFPNSFVIKSVDINPADNSIVITSEISRYSSFSTYQYNSQTRMGTWYTYHRFTTQDILLINADQNGNIKWLNALPKSQLESVRTPGPSNRSGLSFSYDRNNYFILAGGLPFYSSYKSMLVNNNLVLIMNDHTSNNVNPSYGDRVKTVMNFKKRSNLYGVSIDLSTGKMTRKTIASNNDETIMLPRHSFVVNNEFFVPSWRVKSMGKTELKFAKITVK